MFKLKPKDQPRTFRKKVEFQQPNLESGYDKGSFMCTYVVLSSEEAPTAVQELTAKEFGKRVMVGFDEVVDGEGKSVSFSEAARDELLDEPVIAVAVRDTYFAAVAGGQVKRKN